MGKKEKKKGKGIEKTTAKTEKKLTAKQKKHLAAIGEVVTLQQYKHTGKEAINLSLSDDIEKILAEIEEEERKRLEVKEWNIIKPGRRANFTFCGHPTKDELVLFGGEYFNGQKTVVYNDLIFYNINKNEWTIVQAPSPPPPRCGHQMVALAKGKGQLWIFGGEFTSSTQNQFHHYKDLWVFHIADKKWEKVMCPNGPSPRSGHRMVVNKNFLIVFGGYHDNLRQYKYFNDIYAFDLDNYKWNKLEITGTPPAPRSGCQMVSLPDGKILIHGGYSKETVKKDVDKGIVHSDTFLLIPEKSDTTGLRWRWSNAKLGGIRLSPRSGVSIALGPGNQAYSFGGVFDEEESEEDISGKFFNDLNAIDLEKRSLRPVTLIGSKSTVKKKRRRNKADGEVEEKDEDDEEMENVEEEEEEVKVMTVTDGVFTMTVGSSKATADTSIGVNDSASNVFLPPPRMNCGLAVKHGNLYLYGGILEDGDKQLTLSDMYSLDIHKLDNWKVIFADEEVGADWVSSESESDDEDEEDSEDEEETMDTSS